jgi:hypothetical protein
MVAVTQFRINRGGVSVRFVLVAADGVSMTALRIRQNSFETDLIKTSGGDLKITFIGHGSLIFTYGGKVIHVDPFSKLADYSTLPKADLILITHEHADHLDLEALNKVRIDKTVILTENCAKKVKGGMVLKNGDAKRGTIENRQPAITWSQT